MMIHITTGMQFMMGASERKPQTCAEYQQSLEVQGNLLKAGALSEN